MFLQRFPLLIAALWWGGLSGISFVAVPLLFTTLGPAVAGPVAARLFSLQCWIGLVLGLALLLMLRRQRDQAGAMPADAEGAAHSLALMHTTLTHMGIVIFAMLLALLQEFGVAQNILTARASGGNLRLWHALGSLMVLGQWLCAGSLVWRLSRK